MKNIGIHREGYDQFYTKKNIAEQCCEIIKRENIIKNNELIIEPSAGNGAYIDFIKKLSSNWKFYDIDPKHEEIIEQDFLQLSLNDENYHIIGNPPFGRQSSMAKKFIKKCFKAKSICFILPKSFKKESYQKAFPLNFHLIYEWDLPENSFTIDNDNDDKNNDHNVPCVFQIWKRKKHNRTVKIREDPVNFKFVKKEENPDISFRRVGVYAGNIDTKYQDKNITTHYFIKFLDSRIMENLSEFKKIKFQTNNTVGAKSISKQEVIEEFNKLTKYFI